MARWSDLPIDIQRRILASARYMRLNDRAYARRDAERRAQGRAFRIAYMQRRIRAWISRKEMRPFRERQQISVVRDMRNAGLPTLEIYRWILRHP